MVFRSCSAEPLLGPMLIVVYNWAFESKLIFVSTESKKTNLKISGVRCRPFRLGHSVLIIDSISFYPVPSVIACKYCIAPSLGKCPIFAILFQHCILNAIARISTFLNTLLTTRGTLMTSTAADVIDQNGRKIGRFKLRRFSYENMPKSAGNFA